VSFTHGGYFPREWGWALLVLALASLLAVLVRDRLPAGRLELAAVLLLLAFVAWTALSTVWSVSAAQPVLAAERALVYATALPAMLLAVRGRSGAPLVAGAVAGAAAVCLYAVAGRLAPGTLTAYPPSDSYQLQEPIGYWNGLAALAAIGAVAAAVSAAEPLSRAWRAAAAATLPLLVVTLYLTFSRGGAVALLAGLCAAVVLVRSRLHFLVVVAMLAPAAAVATWFASRHRALTHSGATLATARAEGWRVGVVLLVCVVLAATVAALVLPELERCVAVPRRVQRAVGASLLALVVLAAAAVVVREGGPSGLASRVSSSFTSSLPSTGGDLNRRLTSFSSDGRADYWRIAWREVRAHPLLGGGAGSYVRFWHRYRPTSYETQNAHNLYLETLAEEGPVGLALLVGAFAMPLVAALRRRGRAGAAAGGAAFAAYAVHAALDWDFQIVAVTFAALLCAAAALTAARADERGPALTPRLRYPLAAAAAAVAAIAIAFQAGNSALANASDALGRGDLARAERLGERARTWQPWSYEPWQLLGEVSLAAGRRAEARRRLQEALRRDPQDWAAWADLADASSGPARRHAAARARELSPRGP
jgi:hypothetical protein